MFSRVRAWRWQYLLEPRRDQLNSFRATAVGFAATTILPARAGEVIRPYFLSRHERMSATAAFATVILERVLDMLTVLVLLAAYVFVFRPELATTNAVAFEAVKWAGGTAAVGALAALVVFFVLAGDPARLGRTLFRLERVLPSTLAGLLARVAEKFPPGWGRTSRALLWPRLVVPWGSRSRWASGRRRWPFISRSHSRIVSRRRPARRRRCRALLAPSAAPRGV